jgi:hypothetical protein
MPEYGRRSPVRTIRGSDTMYQTTNTKSLKAMKTFRLALASGAFVLAVGAAFATKMSPNAVPAYHKINDNPSFCKLVGSCSNTGTYTCVIQGQQALRLNGAGTQCTVFLNRDTP